MPLKLASFAPGKTLLLKILNVSVPPCAEYPDDYFRRTNQRLGFYQYAKNKPSDSVACRIFLY